MKPSIRTLCSALAAIALSGTLLVGCGENHGPSVAKIPLYPNSNASDSMEFSSPGGFMGGNMRQYTTTDTFDEVVGFYTESLEPFHPQVMSHRSELGRQTAFAIPQEDGLLSVAVQEFTEDGTVNITLAGVGG